ncbi:acyl-CoA thioesterase [Shewanella surugensis]|uniref:Acyl-CoA thioesterase n=1 Tax=Shewanella surugensis TaxID=212020 RepID=A0ABT0LA41_9GAMM|nr:thioesterase family protein [Shewanella surugensis]MCL1124026.1 acyl-CoA thioesterase [Shewanella surugensis]
MEEFLEQYPIHTKITVAWGDMDALQHVNNVIYFKYFETARIDFFKQINLLKATTEIIIGPVISENQAKYQYPVTFPDTLIIGVTISEIGNDRFMMHYYTYSEKLQKITTVGWSKVVMFNFKTGQKAAITPELLNALQQYEH